MTGLSAARGYDRLRRDHAGEVVRRRLRAHEHDFFARLSTLDGLVRGELDPADLFQRAVALQKRGKYRAARRLFWQLIEEHPTSPFAPEAEDRSGPNAFLGCSLMHEPRPSERRIDVALMGDGYLFDRQDRFNKDAQNAATEFSPAAMNLLMNHDWPGNVRELENAVQRAVILAGGDIIRQGHVVNIIDTMQRVDIDVPQTSEELKRMKKIARQKSVENVEKPFVLGALKRNGWNVTRAAEETGMQRSNFQALMAKYDIRIRSTGPED